jgi:hypothetical protein
MPTILLRMTGLEFRRIAHVQSLVRTLVVKLFYSFSSRRPASLHDSLHGVDVTGLLDHNGEFPLGT